MNSCSPICASVYPSAKSRTTACSRSLSCSHCFCASLFCARRAHPSASTRAAAERTYTEPAATSRTAVSSSRPAALFTT
jgi:hypothetical protein